MKTPRALVLLAGLALAATSCGDDDPAPTAASDTTADRTIEIAMRDIAFEPDTVTVSAGDTVRFVFTNEGEAVHDAFIGDARAQADHEREMRGDEDMAHDDEHDSSNNDAISVDPGDTGELTHTFMGGDRLLIGCHQPGHYAAGMKLTVEVT